MKISDTDLDVRDREWAEQALGQDEELLLAVKPKARLSAGALAFFALFTALSAEGFIGMLSDLLPERSLAGNGDIMSFLMTPFILIPFILFCSGAWGMAAALMEPRALRRSLYLVTTRRLLCLTVSAWRSKKREESYEIRPRAMICAENVKANGCGDLRIEYETEEETLEHGALIERMPQAKRVAETLQAQSAAMSAPPAEETAAADAAAPGKKPKPPVAKAPLVILGIFALSFGGVGGYMAWNTADLFLNGEAAEGTVAGYEYTEDEEGGTVAHAVIRYVAKDGRAFREMNPIGTSFNGYDLGEKVTVYYDPAKPDRMQVQAPSTFLLPGAFAIAGLVCIALFIAQLVRAMRDRRRQA